MIYTDSPNIQKFSEELHSKKFTSRRPHKFHFFKTKFFKNIIEVDSCNSSPSWVRPFPKLYLGI